MDVLQELVQDIKQIKAALGLGGPAVTVKMKISKRTQKKQKVEMARHTFHQKLLKKELKNR